MTEKAVPITAPVDTVLTEDDAALSAKEMGARLSIHPETVKKYYYQGRIRGFHIGSNLRFPVIELKRILQNGLPRKDGD